jgi:Alpha/beta hydrolase domain
VGFPALSTPLVVIDNGKAVTGRLRYPAASLATSQASLTVRVHSTDPPTAIPSTGWEYVDAQTIRLLPAGTPFQQGTLYELTYRARDPIVAGLGFAATRDVAAFLRHAATDDDGNPNPLAGSVRFVYSFSVSQPTRFMRDFLHLGFNEDEQGRRVFDGILNWIGGASGGFFNT